ncbi:hypothetical protein TAMC210_04750 [Thermanaeromonas sp. C210]|nr:hypothetical protein TAMC210_04750 [Thermanaeromonas sp. C210]
MQKAEKKALKPFYFRDTREGFNRLLGGLLVTARTATRGTGFEIVGVLTARVYPLLPLVFSPYLR